jgi:hypothetical protein
MAFGEAPQARAGQRVAVIGDVGGHLGALTAELTRLGADPQTSQLPADLCVIQVGDLVHRGPESEGVVALVDRYLRESPSQWIQLAGNHEAQYLREPAFDWPQRIDGRAAAMLREWWQSGRMRVAVALRAADDEGVTEDFVVTHAGLTEGFWRLALDGPRSAQFAAAAINSFIGTHEDVLFAAGQMLGNGRANLSAGPVWAAAASELVPSWFQAAVPMPFSQIHGHSTLVNWKRRQLWCAPEIASAVSVDEEAAQAAVRIPGGRIIGVDPGHGATPRPSWRAFVLQNARVIR